MFDVVLYQPEIPPNTGNVMRLCTNTGCRLHLVHPLGFHLTEARLKRAAMDYREWAEVRHHQSLEQFLDDARPPRLLAYSTRGSNAYSSVGYRPGDALLFGPETRGLPQPLLERIPSSQRLRLPMRPGSRSLNLANAVAVVVYDAWRQLGFAGGS
jgi:tRNA (cytidine/uridine-2'-O-)-methyltransferase